MSCPINAVSHDRWPERERALIENPPELTLVLQEHLKHLSESLSETLQPVLALERCFGEQNNKTMYLAPFIRSVIHAAATGIDIEHISLYPLAIDPCVTRHPLLREIRVPRYGVVTGIVCASIPFPINFPEANNHADSIPEEEPESDDEEASIDFRDFAAGKGIKKSAPTKGNVSYDRSAVLDHSFLARLTVDLVEKRTPLGLLCVAQAQDLHSAMSSCLFQRLAWGVREPLMGIALDSTTTVVRILTGWLEEFTESDCFIIHIAQDTSGVYDLSNTSDSLKFASIMAHVGGRFPTICGTAVTFTDQLRLDISEHRLKSWRLDQIGLFQCIVPEEEPSSFIDTWFAGLDPPTTVSPSEYIKGENALDSPSALSQMPPIPLAGESAPTIPKPSSIKSKASTNSSIPASKFAAGGNEDNKSILMQRWLYIRLATLRTLPFYPMLQDKSLTFDPLFHMISSQYYEHTAFSWLATPPTDESLNKLAIVQIGNRTAKVKGVSQFPPYKPLSGESQKILLESLGELDVVLQDIQRLKQGGKNSRNEAEYRQNIDRLILQFFHGRIDGTTTQLSKQDYRGNPHIMTSLERTLRLPLGYLAQGWPNFRPTLPKIAHSEISRFSANVMQPSEAALLSDWGNLTEFSTRVAAEPANYTPAFLGDVSALQNVVASTIQATTLDIVSDPALMYSFHDREPDKAICDSVGYIRIPDVFTSNAASTSFNLINPPSKDEKKTSAYSFPDTNVTSGEETLGTGPDREKQMGRPFEVGDINDIHASSQSFAVVAGPILPEPSEPTSVDDTDTFEEKPKEMHSCKVRIGDENTDDDAIDMRHDLFLPIIVGEYKRALNTFRVTSVNQGRMYATAAVKFYAAMGIYGLGVYSIVSEGFVMVVTVSYGEEYKDIQKFPRYIPTPPRLQPSKVHIIERNACSFDISEPIGLITFATFLIKLRIEYVPEVWKKVEEAGFAGTTEARRAFLKSHDIPIAGSGNHAHWRKYKSASVEGDKK